MPQPGRLSAKARDPHEAARRLSENLLHGSREFMRRRSDLWEPPMDVYETGAHVVIKMELPGVKACDLRVRFEGDAVTIRGYRDVPCEAGVTAYHQMEIRHGYFERSVIVRKPINPEATEAEYREGFLWLRIPKAAGRTRQLYSIRLRL